MHYQNYINDIIKAFDEEIDSYCFNKQINTYTIESIYHKNDLKARIATISYNSYKIIYKFTIHTFLSQVNHVLEAHISFFDGINYPIHHVLGYYHIEASEIFLFPCVSNPMTMHAALNMLIDNVDYCLPQILQYNPVYLYQDYRKDVCDYYKIELDDYDLYMHNSFIETNQYSELGKAYFEYLMMNYDSSLKLYSKKKKLSFYEIIINNIMKRDIKHKELPYSIQYHLGFYDKQGLLKTDRKDIISVILSVIVLTIGWGIFFYIFHLGLSKIVIPYDLYIQVDFFYLFIVFFVLAILSAYYKRFTFYRIFFKKDYNNYVERDFLQNSKASNRIMDKLMYLSTFIGLVSVVLFANCYIAFGDDGIINNLSLFDLHGKYYEYEEIYIEHYQDQLNGYDELIGEETYVIKGNDLEIDLYEYIMIEDAYKDIIPFLESKNVTFKQLDIYPYKE